VTVLLLAADGDFNNDIVCGLLLRNAKLNMVRVQDAGPSGTANPAVLE
jgi:hypothetical protein